MTITTSIPATSAASPQPEVLGASHMLGIGVLVGVGVGAPGTGVGVGVGVGVATATTLMVTSTVLLTRNASLA